MNNNSYKYRQVKRGYPFQNYTNFKAANPHHYINNINKAPENNLSTALSENFQNINGRNSFFQNFWKNYSKSYDYDYFITSTDNIRAQSSLYDEINKIMDENSLKIKENVYF